MASNPFMSPKSQRFYDDSENPQNYKLIQVDPNSTNQRRMEGFLLVSDKYAERVITYPMYLPAAENEKRDFLKSTNAVNKAIAIKDYVKNDGSYLVNNLKREARGLCFLFPTASPDVVKVFIENTLVDAIKDLPAGMRKIKEEELPKLRVPQDFVSVPTWDSVCDNEDIEFLLKKYVDNVEKFLKESKDNLYNLWTVGKLPVVIMRKYCLREKELHPTDFDRLTKANNAAAIDLTEVEQANKKAKLEEAKVEEDEVEETEVEEADVEETKVEETKKRKTRASNKKQAAEEKKEDGGAHAHGFTPGDSQRE